jgi:hypothetical protein
MKKKIITREDFSKEFFYGFLFDLLGFSIIIFVMVHVLFLLLAFG